MCEEPAGLMYSAAASDPGIHSLLRQLSPNTKRKYGNIYIGEHFLV